MNNPIFLITIVILAVYLNLVATFHLSKNEGYEIAQKMFQALLVWLIPFLGSLIIIRASVSDREYIKALRKQKWAAAPLGKMISLTLLAFDGSEKPGEGGYGGGCGSC